jgi:PAS domain S-box-containing protein
MKWDVFDEKLQTLRGHLGEAPNDVANALEDLASTARDLRAQHAELAELDRVREEERHRYQDLFEAAPDAYLITDARGVIQEANRAAALLLNVSRELLAGKPLVVFVASKDRRLFRAAFSRITTAEPVREQELCMQPRKAPPFTAGVSMTALRNGRGRRLMRAWILRDITGRGAETRLASLPVALFGVDREGALTFGEGAAWISLAELDELPILDATGERTSGTAVIRRVLAGETVAGTFELAGNSYHLHCQPHDGGVFGVATQMTRAHVELAQVAAKEHEARRAAELAGRQSELLAEVSRALTSSLDAEKALSGVARLFVAEIADLCAIYLVENSGELRRVALAENQLAPGIGELLTHFPAEDRLDAAELDLLRRDRSMLRSEVADGETIDGVVFSRWLTKQGVRIRSYVSTPLIARGKLLGMLALFSASEDRRLGEAECALAEKAAVHMALGLDNARLYRRAQDAVRARDEFLCIAAHELKSPVTSLQLGVQNALRHLRAEAMARELRLPATFASGLEIVERQSKRLVGLVDELFDLARITAGRLDLALRDFDFVEIVHEALDAVREEADNAGSEVTLEAPPSLPGRWDRGRLCQCAINLLSNAIKYGGGKPIEVRLWAEGDRARLSVRDYGTGIAPEDQSRIFERFERAGNSHDHVGLGLGLYIVSRIARAHGGDVQVRSEPGQGATFILELPRGGPPAHTEVHAPRG